MLYKINLPQVAHETIDNETFIINTTNGMYFVAAGYAAIIWNAIANGYSFTAINKALETAAIFDDNKKILESFISQLLQEKLITEGNSGGKENQNPLHIEKNLNFQEPVLTKYDDLQEVVALDPIHDVSESAGWPFQK